MKIKPIGERLLVKREAVETKSSGGIILTEASQERPNQGEVKALGKVEDIEIGDTVVFGRYSGGDTLEVDGEELLILELKDIKAVIYG
jgi:chaperonin GroES